MQVEVSSCFFIGTAVVELRSSGAPDAAIDGLSINHNQFLAKASAGVSVWVNETAGSFTDVRQARIDDNVFEGSLPVGFRRGTSVRRSVTLAANASQADFELAGSFAFPCHRIDLQK